MKTYAGPEWHNADGVVFRPGEIFLTGALKHLPHGAVIKKIDTRNGMDRYELLTVEEKEPTR